ncbi:TPA: integrase core domain-containing protein [Escherichia coli]
MPGELSNAYIKQIFVRIDTRNQESGLIRYSVFLPYAKQRRVTTERLFLAIPPEIGELIMNYTVRYKKNPEDKLFDFSVSAPHYVSQAINQAILNFCPPEYQAAVACGEAALPTITPTDLRHNVGHSLAMQGASAEEIAHVLGHTSLAVAKYYIMATPALALIRAKALGSNPVWQNMVAMMLTGELVDSAHWKGHPVVGLVGDELHDKIGGCSRNSSTCPFSEVRSCYGCLYYTRECLGICVGQNLRSSEVAEMLDTIALRRPLPQLLKTDNGSEFAGKMLDKWVYERDIRIDFSRPGTPTDNATVESFNGRLRQECLNENWFMSKEDARCKIEVWRIHYNQSRPHSALGWMTPCEFAEKSAGCQNKQPT